MAKHTTHKATRQGRNETIARKQRRRQKYRPGHDSLEQVQRDLAQVKVITVLAGAR